MSKQLALVVVCVYLIVSYGGAFAEEQPKSDVQQSTQPEALDVADILKRLKQGNSEGSLESLNQLRLAEIENLSGDLKMDAIEQCARLMQSKDNDVASRACDVLSRFDSDAVPLLIEALQSDDAVFQSRAARALGSIASRHESQLPTIDAAIPHLAKLLDNGAKNVRHNAFCATSAMGPEAIPHMINALDAEEYFQQVMLKGFVRHGEKSVVPLCEALTTGDTATRRSAANMLFFISWQAPDDSLFFKARRSAP